jgi:outer membrane lipoprotein carrier protein
VNVPKAAKYLGLLMLANAWPMHSADLMPTLRGIENRYNKADTLQASFTETFTRRPRKTTEKGVLYRRKGGKMRWEYTEPAGKLWISDGKNTFFYDPADHKVEQAPLKESDDARAPLAFMMGRIDFDRDFGHYETGVDGVITLKPRSDKFPYSEISLLADSNFAIRRLIVKLQDNSQLEYLFDGEKLNPALAESLFHFTPPPGAQIVKPESH